MWAQCEDPFNALKNALSIDYAWYAARVREAHAHAFSSPPTAARGVSLRRRRKARACD